MLSVRQASTSTFTGPGRQPACRKPWSGIMSCKVPPARAPAQSQPALPISLSASSPKSPSPTIMQRLSRPEAISARPKRPVRLTAEVKSAATQISGM